MAKSVRSLDHGGVSQIGHWDEWSGCEAHYMGLSFYCPGQYNSKGQLVLLTGLRPKLASASTALLIG